MRSDEAARIIEKEKRCVLTDCERPECKKCGLVMDTGEILEALDMAISALEKQEQDRWIPCKERLPEENGTYLACYEDATVLLDWFNGKWFFYRTNPAVEETGTIIAWRPLPEPYTEEES